MRPRPFVTTGAALALTAAGLAGPLGTSAAHASWGAAGPTSCATSRMLCTEVSDTQSIWGNHYVGHDEPSLLFYSKTPGSGNRMQYNLTLPTEPAGPYSQTNSYNFELHPAFWF
ncbi:MAG TPA: hypothetical protein VNE21_03860, partial [Mycobacteriales bacterium]|nr:hypothetical protein [Mycobacteriales bacterium]